jgi:hypothetical protein
MRIKNDVSIRGKGTFFGPCSEKPGLVTTSVVKLHRLGALCIYLVFWRLCMVETNGVQVLVKSSVVASWYWSGWNMGVLDSRIFDIACQKVDA